MNIIQDFLNNIWESLKAGWKNTITTILGSGVLALIIPQLIAWLDNDPTTLPNWQLVIAEVLAGLGLIASRDANKTSEQSGAIKCEVIPKTETTK